MSVKNQLLLGFAPLILALAVMSAASVFVLARSLGGGSGTSIAEREDFAALERLRFRAERLVSATRGYLLTGDTRYLERAQVAAARVDQTLEELGIPTQRLVRRE